jgi:hypothetical protein
MLVAVVMPVLLEKVEIIETTFTRTRHYSAQLVNHFLFPLP